jgi:hypothetical protein
LTIFGAAKTGEAATTTSAATRAATSEFRFNLEPDRIELRLLIGQIGDK